MKEKKRQRVMFAVIGCNGFGITYFYKCKTYLSAVSLLQKELYLTKTEVEQLDTFGEVELDSQDHPFFTHITHHPRYQYNYCAIVPMASIKDIEEEGFYCNYCKCLVHSHFVVGAITIEKGISTGICQPCSELLEENVKDDGQVAIIDRKLEEKDRKDSFPIDDSFVAYFGAIKEESTSTTDHHFFHAKTFANIRACITFLRYALHLTDQEIRTLESDRYTRIKTPTFCFGPTSPIKYCQILTIEEVVTMKFPANSATPFYRMDCITNKQQFVSKYGSLLND
jgi:hypothetical protein